MNKSRGKHAFLVKKDAMKEGQDLLPTSDEIHEKTIWFRKMEAERLLQQLMATML